MKKFLQNFLCLALLIVLGNGSVLAFTTLLTFAENKDEEWYQFYVSGIVEGFESANYRLGADGSAKLFCLPNGLGLNTSNVMQWLEDDYETFRDDEELLRNAIISSMILRRFQELFPCSDTPALSEGNN